MTSELPIPLTVLVLGASEARCAELASALPAAEIDVLRFANLDVDPATPREFIDLCIVDSSEDEEAGLQIVARARRRWPTVGICCVGCDDIVAALTAGADDAMPRSAPLSSSRPRSPRRFVGPGSPAPSSASRSAMSCTTARRAAYGAPATRCSSRRVSCGCSTSSFFRAGNPVSIDTLQDYVWSDDVAPESNALAVYVSYLRRKLQGSRHAMVETMRGVCYRLARRAE